MRAALALPVRFAAFGSVGAACLALNLLVLWALTSGLGLHYLLSTAVAFSTITPLGFVLNKVVTFRTKREAAPVELPRYFAAMAASFAANLALMYLLVSVLGLWFLAASLFVAILLLIVNFWTSDRWSFRSQGADSRAGFVFADPWVRRFAAACLAMGAFSILFILHHTDYPYEPYLPYIAEYFLRTQDVAAAALLMALVAGALFAPTRGGALAVVEAMSRHPRLVACAAFVVLVLGALFIERAHPLPQDEYAAVFQSEVFAGGRLTGQFPPDLLGRLIPPHYLNQFLHGSFKTGEVASSYWPGFALLLTPFTFLQVPWACNPLLASLSLVLMSRLAVRLSGNAQAGGWAMLLALASPGFTATAITYFSMTAHLLFNLVFAWLLLERSSSRLFLAGLVGSFALVLHNPLPHALFALPWIAWLAVQPERYRHLLALAAGYVPLLMVLGFGWALVLSNLLGETPYALFPDNRNPVHAIANFLWTWHVKVRTIVEAPAGGIFAARLAELTRLWNWAVPGLPLLALLAWWRLRGAVGVRLLGLSFASTALGYLLIVYTQGHGWGARYLHPAWGALPVLGALALAGARPVASAAAAGFVASVAVLSLVFATGLRAAQIRDYIDAHLAKRPPLVAGAKQVVFVRARPTNMNADLVQNDPFLRNDVLMLLSIDPETDVRLVRRKFPGARLAHSDERGTVWVLQAR